MASHLIPFDSERLLALVQFLELTGTPLQIKTAELSDALGMPVQAVSRYVKWAEKYGIIEVDRTAAGFATGRSPNTYHLLIGLDRWKADGPDIVESLRVRPPEPPPAPKSLPSAKPASDELAKEVRPGAARLVREALPELGPIPDPIPVEVMDDAEVEHWLGIED